MWLNYQHLHYFWVVARAPSLTAAARQLRLAPSTISTQIKTLEGVLGQALFQRKGRKLVLTEHGRVVLAYADDIFALGEELIDAARSRLNPLHVHRFRVGIANNLPKLVAHHLMIPASRVEGYPVHLVCLQGKEDALVAQIVGHHLDIVLTDRAVGLVGEVGLQSRVLGDCPVSLMATRKLAARYLSGFPQSLEGAPLLLPEPGARMRVLVEEYFHGLGLRPHVVAESGETELLKTFGQAGMGIFPVPSLVVPEVSAQCNVVELGRIDSAREQYHAVFHAGRENHPAIHAILRAAADLPVDAGFEIIA